MGQSEVLLSSLRVILHSVPGSGVVEHAAFPPALILTHVLSFVVNLRCCGALCVYS